MSKTTDQTDPYEIFSAYYDLAWDVYAEYCCDLILAAEESALRPFRRICDAACGTGLLLELLGRSVGDGTGASDGPGASHGPGQISRHLCGFDLSSAMIEKARERLPGCPLKLADLRNPFPFQGPLDLVTCMHDSLNYLLEPEELKGFFTRVRRVLAPDAVFICDINSPELYIQQQGKHMDYLLKGKPVRQSMDYRPEKQHGITRFHFPEGSEEHIQRAYEPDEVEHLLQQAGLYLTDSFEVEDEDHDPHAAHGPGSGKIVYVTVKA
ncbi:class I SAM-dependent DNA methyltransferase [Spirochaeta dissipatitropha]